MAKRRRSSRKAGAIARQLLSVPPDSPNERGEVGENGIIKARDPQRERLVIPRAGSVTISHPPPRDEVMTEKIRGLPPNQAMAILMANDLENGDFVRVWEKLKAMAMAGDFRAIQEYQSRFLGKLTQNVAIAARVKHDVLSDEDRKLLKGLRSIFGMPDEPGTGPEIVADAPAEEIEPEGAEAQEVV